MSRLNPTRINMVRESLAWAAVIRQQRVVPNWRAVHAGLLADAHRGRMMAHLAWDYTTTIWVCQCCILVVANGECCADDVHGGDGIEPLSDIRPNDGLSPGIFSEQHSPRCTDADREEGCDCEHDTFSMSQCRGCGSWLAGDRYAMTLFVNNRRPVPVNA